MQYLITFLEGIITFISPCLLPMLPVYVSYFAGGGSGGAARTLRNALGFVLGFTLVFVAMGALAGTAGAFLRGHQTLVNIVSGAAVGLIHLNRANWGMVDGHVEAMNLAEATMRLARLSTNSQQMWE